MHEVNKDLQRERQNCTFDVEEMTVLYDGGKEKTAERRYRDNVMVSTKDYYSGVPEYYLGAKEKYEESIRKSVIIFGLVRKMQREGRTKITDIRHFLQCLLGSAPTYDGTSMALHYLMFVPAIVSQGTEEQQAHWLPRAWNGNFIGSFAQTELGHGTFIRGLETTATYDPDTQEFVLHSPTLTSHKWWAGGLGHTANHAIVVAQLYTTGQCHGVHAFIVPIRDEQTHQPLPGIRVGDVGGKLGLEAVNNGFLGFNHVRIPRNNMLMKHAQVLKDGTYMKTSDGKLIYATMLFMRVVIAYDMVNYLTKAVTIATRYSAVRRQTPVRKDGPELQILDYLTQQHKLLITIATAFGFKIISTIHWDTYDEINEQVANGKLDRLPELHALVCCLKAIVTSDTAQCIERCRLACGGYGYMLSSNLPALYGQVTAACIYEGDNTVLLLQTARFLLKTWQRLDSHTLPPTVAYLKTASSEGFLPKWENSAEGIIRGLQVVAMRKISACAAAIEKRVTSGVPLEQAWNLSSVQLVAAAEAHGRVVLATYYYEGANKMIAGASASTGAVLRRLLELYLVYWALQSLVDLLKYTNISERGAEELQAWYEELLVMLRPNAVGLVDAFDIRDKMLHSTLGSYDGRVYERLMEEAQKSPLNKDPDYSPFHKYLKPYMQGKL
ncbi:probable peroxisomal acyl-coenzyme A oxidase 1 [Ostrinia furnacalis]|uniref:probable peroxisomal acyl-coenzyme A oxidase 1 n=1 Tax=Ostrinia furnacalis TaxID=93504 RepID=UPI0010391C55|nr:probable peroxisomal acyl-coenzyme A oxidase 1 [Ostrinia furnacalis]